jgi:hypothetical protein
MDDLSTDGALLELVVKPDIVIRIAMSVNLPVLGTGVGRRQSNHGEGYQCENELIGGSSFHESPVPHQAVEMQAGGIACDKHTLCQAPIVRQNREKTRQDSDPNSEHVARQARPRREIDTACRHFCGASPGRETGTGSSNPLDSMAIGRFFQFLQH